MNLAGLPAEVKTILTSSSITTLISFSESRRNNGTLTPNELEVAILHFRICSRSKSGFIEPEPINPSPPQFETAEASFHPDTQTIPP